MRGVVLIVVLAALPGCRWLFGIDDTTVAGDAGADADRTMIPDAIVDGPPNPRDPDAAVDAAFCPPGYTLRAPSSCHRLSTNDRSWSSAEAECESQGAHLVVVDDLAEHQAIPTGVWIGYSERVLAGFFRWVTDSTSNFTAWAPQEPTLPGGASCVSTATDGWNDEQCDNNKRFVCEYDGLPANPSHF